MYNDFPTSVLSNATTVFLSAKPSSGSVGLLRFFPGILLGLAVCGFLPKMRFSVTTRPDRGLQRRVRRFSVIPYVYLVPQYTWLGSWYMLVVIGYHVPRWLCSSFMFMTLIFHSPFGSSAHKAGLHLFDTFRGVHRRAGCNTTCIPGYAVDMVTFMVCAVWNCLSRIIMVMIIIHVDDIHLPLAVRPKCTQSGTVPV